MQFIETRLEINRKTERAVMTVNGTWFPKSQVQISFSGVFILGVSPWMFREKFGYLPAQPVTPKIEPKPLEMPNVPYVPVSIGIYETPNGEIFKVKKGRYGSNYALFMTPINGERLNAKGEIIKAEFVYRRHANDMRKLRADFKVTRERAEELSLRFGHCLACGHGLKVAKSVLRGLGPVCAKRIDYWA